MHFPQIHTDRRALERNRAKARLGSSAFLHETAIEEIEFRLGMVNREFTSPVLVSPPWAEWRAAFPSFEYVAEADTLELKPNSHDLVVHAMSLHWSNDIVGQLIQSRRALKPDGLLLACCLGGETLHELRSSLAETEVALTGGLSPRVAMMAEIKDLGALLQRAGFALPVVDKVTLLASYNDLVHLRDDLRLMGETNALTHRKRSLDRRELFALADDFYSKNFGNGSGRIKATFEIMFLTGWSPHIEQQQPLRPGSATKRLADALGTSEIKLPASAQAHGRKKDS